MAAVINFPLKLVDMRNRLFKTGGKRFFIFAVIAIILSVAAVGTIAYRQMYDQRRSMAAEGNSFISSQVSVAMTLWLDDQVQMAQIFASAPEIIEYCKSPLDMEKRAAATAFLERYQRISPHFTLITVMYFMQEGEDMLSITVDGKRHVIENGASLLDSVGGLSLGVGDMSFSYIKGVYDGSPSFISEAKPNAVPGLPPIYVVAVPVKDEHGTLLAGLGFGVKLDYFSSQFITNFRLGETGRIEILDNRGFFVGSPDRLKVLSDKYVNEGKAILAKTNAHTNVTFTIDGSDGPIDFSASPVWVRHEMSTPWWVLFHRSSEELHHELTRSRNWLIAVCSVASLFMVLMAYMFSKAAAGEVQERAMRKEAGLKKIFVDTAPYAVIHVGNDWRLLGVNPAACVLFEYSEKELLGITMDKLIVPEDGMFSEKVLREPSGECTGTSKRGRLLTFVYDFCRLEGGEFLVFLRDETELAAQRRKTTELSESLARSLGESERHRVEADRANNAKSEFLANMSHEIRTPMNAIIGMTHLLLQQKMDDRLRDYAQKIQTAGKSLLGVINSVLDFSKIEAGKMVLETVPFDLLNVLERITSIYQQPFVDKGLRLTLACDPDVPRRLKGDPLRLEQVITNLVSNGLKFTEKGGVTIFVRKLHSDDASVLLEFRVTDTGIGMTEEESKRLFKAFSQADTSTTRKYGGTGLGLVIAKLLVELMDGVISLESEAGKGTTFSFTARFGCPGCSEDEEKEARPAYVPGSGILEGKRILLVEDNPINQDVARELLAGVGVVVSIAENGQKAVEALAHPEHGFDLVLMDVQMPIMDGHEAARRTRTFEHNRCLPIVAMTAHAMTSERDRCLESGMNAHLSKPIEVETLYQTLEAWLGPRNGAP